MYKYNEESLHFVQTDVKICREPSRNQDAKRPLDKHVNNAVQTEKFTRQKRTKLYALRAGIGDFYDRVKPCGRYQITKSDYVPVAKTKGGKFSFTGLQSCCSVWACPVCSAKITSRRSEEVRQMLKTAIISDKHKGAFITLTLPHQLQENLNELAPIVKKAWRQLTAENEYKGQYRTKNEVTSLVKPGLKQEYDVKGFIRSLEIKHGINGWHPHLHICFVLGADNNGTHLQDFCERIISLWSAIISKLSKKKVKRAALDYKEIYNAEDIAYYISKTENWDLAKEITQSNRKEGAGLTPFQLFEYYEKTGDKTYLNYFLEYCEATKGIKSLTFSQDFKKLFYRLEEKELTDAEICQDDKPEQIIYRLDKQIFNYLVIFRQHGELLNFTQYEPENVLLFLNTLFDDRIIYFNPPESIPTFKLAPFF